MGDLQLPKGASHKADQNLWVDGRGGVPKMGGGEVDKQIHALHAWADQQLRVTRGCALLQATHSKISGVGRPWGEFQGGWWGRKSISSHLRVCPLASKISGVGGHGEFQSGWWGRNQSAVTWGSAFLHPRSVG